MGHAGGLSGGLAHDEDQLRRSLLKRSADAAAAVQERERCNHVQSLAATRRGSIAAKLHSTISGSGGGSDKGSHHGGSHSRHSSSAAASAAPAAKSLTAQQQLQQQPPLEVGQAALVPSVALRPSEIVHLAQLQWKWLKPRLLCLVEQQHVWGQVRSCP